ncbi:MAG: HdeD family acid-resistance protein [Candidatus Velthaea sp.]|jgi:uncharacterized membrane protein HdeD (DUF308 family)
MIADAISQLSAKWWTFLLRGIIALVLAAIAFVMPVAMAAALVYIFAVYFIISGVVALVGGFSFNGVGHWWSLILMGIIQAALGFLMLAAPGAGPLALAYLFAIWMIMTGSMEISGAIALRGVVSGEFWWILLGIITLLFGFYAVLVPGLGILALVYTVGFYALLAGISLIAFAVRVKGLGVNVKHQATAQ